VINALASLDGVSNIIMLSVCVVLVLNVAGSIWRLSAYTTERPPRRVIKTLVTTLQPFLDQTGLTQDHVRKYYV
jgi:hypothetical protein